MKSKALVALVVALSMLGCASSSAPYAPGDARASSSASTRAVSWLSPEAAKSPSLLYVANQSAVSMYAYNNGIAGKLMGEIFDVTDVQGMCTDKAGDVWVTQGYPHVVTEYAHGSKTPLTIITRAKGYAVGCAVNPENGDLAVSYNHPNAKGGFSYNLVYIYSHADPHDFKEYANSAEVNYGYFLAYDDAGNLYLDGACQYYDCYPYDLSLLFVLHPGASEFTSVPIDGAQIRSARGLSWIKPTLLIGAYSDESGGTSVGYKLLVTKDNAKVVQTIPYTGTGQFWGSTVRAGNVIVPDQTNDVVRTYSLADGSLISTLKNKISSPFSVVVSQAGK
jgi:hypothetical protein